MFRSLDVKFDDGEVFKNIDLSELFEKVDFLAFNYGLGNHRTLTDYYKMVDEEDPFVVNNLISAALDRIRASHGIETERTKTDDSKTDRTVKYEKQNGDSKDMLKRFLFDFGATSEEMKITEERLKNIKVPEDDFSWITPKKLESPDFDFKGVLKRMNDCNKRSVNVNVSLDTLEKKRKHG